MTHDPQHDCPHPAELVGLFRRLSLPLEPIPTGLSPATQPIPGIRAVLFDIYGTLVISASGDIHAAKAIDPAGALQEALGACGLSPIPGAGDAGTAVLMDHIHRQHRALRDRGVEHPEVDILAIWRTVVRHLVIEALIAVEPDARVLAQLAIEYECRVNPIWPMPAASEVIGALRDRGLRLGIVSNAQFFTPIAIEALLGASPSDLGFDPPLTSWSFRLGEAKPSTRLFLEPLERLREDGIRPDQIAIVGNDRLNDLLPARDLGMRPILFAGDRRSLRLREDDPRCSQIPEVATITHLRQLPDLVA